MSGFCMHVPGVTCDNCRNSSAPFTPYTPWPTWPAPHPPSMGWECPKCGRAYAPWYPSCDQCGKEIAK